MTCTRCGAPFVSDARFCGVCGAPAQATPMHATSAQATPMHATPAQGPPPTGDMAGREIAGRYRLLAKLGEGGMGTVYRAQQLSLKREVALKLLRPVVSADAELVRRFHAEAELAARLNHPNTVTLYDFGQDSDGTLFIAMELVQGRSLRQILAKDGPFPAPRALAIAAQVCSSLADAHAHGIVHRDMKPDNIMLSERGKTRDIVRVLDFGIAKLRDPRADGTSVPMTQAGALLGTPQYMAPEQITGSEIDGRTDVYALGAIVYEMLTGRPPFESPALLGVLTMHLNDTPVPPSRRRPDLAIPPALDALVLAALEKAPERRPPSMEFLAERITELARQLGPVPEGMVAAGAGISGALPVPTPPVSTPPFMSASMAQPVPTPPPVSTPPFMSASMAQPAPAVFTPQPAMLGQVMIPAQMQQPAPRRRWLVPVLGLALIAGGAVAAVLVMQGRTQEQAAGEPEPGDEPAPEPSRPAVSSDFYVPPTRDLYADDDEPAQGGGAQRYVHPVFGYTLELPAGFVEQPTDDDELAQFIGVHDGQPAAIVIVHFDFELQDVNDGMLGQVVAGIASSADAEVVNASFRTVQGAPRISAVVDHDDSGIRFDVVVLPCGRRSIAMMVGVPRASFDRAASFRAELFERRMRLP